MSFRGRLTVFFVAIVVVPMIAVAVLVVQITEDSRDGKADARLAAGLETASVTYDRALLRASEEVERIARSPEVAAALQSGRPVLSDGAGRARDRRPRRSPRSASSTPTAALWPGPAPPTALAFSRKPVEIGDERIGLIKVAVLDPEAYAEEVATLTGVGVVIASAAGELAATIDSGGASLPVPAEGRSLQLPDGEARAAALRLDGAPPGSRLVLVSATGEGFVASEPLVAANSRRLLRDRGAAGAAAAADAPGADLGDARRRQADRLRRLQPEGAGRGPRRDGRPGERVQQDERAGSSGRCGSCAGSARSWISR